MIAPPGRNGDPIKLYPPKAQHYLMVDTMQSFVRQDLFVFRHPLHAVSDLTGHYRIDGVPVGKLKVGATLPIIELNADADVEVRANVVEHVDLTLTYAPHAPAPSDAGRQRPIP
jgi:hypothetical protein